LSDCIMPPDVVTYGVLCALAVYDRKQIREKIKQLGDNWMIGKDGIQACWNIVDNYIN